MEWMTQDKAMRFHGVTDQTLRNWCRKYEVRTRKRDGRIEYHSVDLETAEYRGKHRGMLPPWKR